MLSYKAGLTRIGVSEATSFSYQRDFGSRPKSLRQAIASMDAPTSDQWSQVSDILVDEGWTDEVQGVAWDGSHWIFSTNSNQNKLGHDDRSLYVFKSRAALRDGDWVSKLSYKDVPHEVHNGTQPTEEDNHYGQVTYFDGAVYVSHFLENDAPNNRSRVLVLDNADGVLTFSHWIDLERPRSPTDNREDRPEFQAINPWDGQLYTCFGGPGVNEFFIHDRDGKWKDKRTLKLSEPVNHVQGACFSPNGHLYVATNWKLPGDPRFQIIAYHSALNGQRLGVIPVLAEESEELEPIDVGEAQEVEGLCYADVKASSGERAQIHCVLLDDGGLETDSIFFKSFSAAAPELV